MADSTDDAIEVLARRVPLLRVLADGPRSKRTLVEELSLSRSTIDRAVRDLEALGFVARNDGVSLTLQGRLALDAYEEFADTAAAVDEASAVLDPLPADATVDTALLRGADVVGPDPVSPQRPFVAYKRLVSEATAARGFAPAVLGDNVAVFRDRIVEDGLVADLTVSADALDELVSAYADPVNDALETGRLTLRRATTTLEYGLMLLELPERTVVTALVYDDRGLTGTIRNDAPAAVRWAEGVYEDLREAATPLDR
ncbi:helix-turn-helix transcriptional regulator [Halobacterium yunchengense]|uniref:helix-turn-helix transcriptional regulator n=1 Tax=Halobacterium yunchengense TaxID=3108497 RepID=UPI00300950C8